MSRTHYDVMRDVGDGWDFRKEFIRALTIAKTEYKDKHPLAYAFGAELEPTGRYFCELCDGYLHEEACDGYEDWIRDLLKREVVDEFIQQTCPKCHTPIEEKMPARVVEPTAVFADDPAELDPSMPDEELKTKYEPCGCLHDRGDEMIRWDLDKQAVQEAADTGRLGLRRFEGRVFKRNDGQTEFERKTNEKI